MVYAVPLGPHLPRKSRVTCTRFLKVHGDKNEHTDCVLGGTVIRTKISIYSGPPKYTVQKCENSKVYDIEVHSAKKEHTDCVLEDP